MSAALSLYTLVQLRTNEEELICLFFEAIIVLHLPLIIPTVRRGRENEVQATIDAYRAVAERVADWGPEVLIIT